VTVLLWWFERRSRQAEVEQERIDRREQLEVDRQLRVQPRDAMRPVANRD
jgi:hypothetical protein